jgi:outer membrane lipoprotein-sorting protein
MKLRLAGLAVVLFSSGCPGKGGYVRQGPAPTVPQITARIAQARQALSSFTGGGVMTYWLGKDRVRGEVLVMGKPGAKVRFAALSPAGGSTIIDMACNGTTYAYIDQQHNCQLTGPCNASSIAQFLHVELEPQDFVALALGNPPLLENATGVVSWDAKNGRDLVELTSPAGKQTLAIDTRGGHFDVVESKMMRPDGTLLWSVENKAYESVKDVKGASFRVPMKSQLKSPAEQADLIVEWKEREYNKELADAKFELAPPPGLPRCGG